MKGKKLVKLTIKLFLFFYYLYLLIILQFQYFNFIKLIEKRIYNFFSIF